MRWPIRYGVPDPCDWTTCARAGPTTPALLDAILERFPGLRALAGDPAPPQGALSGDELSAALRHMRSGRGDWEDAVRYAKAGRPSRA